MATWTLDAYDRTGGSLVQAGLGFRNLTYRHQLNAPGSLEAEFSLYASGLTNVAVGQHELQVKRNGTCVWAGPLMQTDVDPQGRRVRFLAEGLLAWFRDRRVTTDLLYAATPQETIAWNLISHTQGQTYGALGITQGSHSGANIYRDRFYCGVYARPNVLEELLRFTEYDNGLDFEIDPAARTFETWQPGRGTTSGISLSGSNVDELVYTEDARSLATIAEAIAENDCAPIIKTATNATAATTYGRRHWVLEPPDEGETDLQGIANEYLRANENTKFAATVVFREDGTGAPSWGSWGIGDTLLLSDNRGYSTFTNKTLRIAEWAVSLDNGLPGTAVIELNLTSETPP